MTIHFFFFYEQLTYAKLNYLILPKTFTDHSVLILNPIMKKIMLCTDEQYCSIVTFLLKRKLIQASIKAGMKSVLIEKCGAN